MEWQRYALLCITVVRRPLANTFVQESGGMSATAEILVDIDGFGHLDPVFASPSTTAAAVDDIEQELQMSNVRQKPICFERQEAQLSLTCRPTFVYADVNISLTQNAAKHSFPCCAVKSCPLVKKTKFIGRIFRLYLYPSPI